MTVEPGNGSRRSSARPMLTRQPAGLAGKPSHSLTPPKVFCMFEGYERGRTGPVIPGGRHLCGAHRQAGDEVDERL